VPSESGCCRFLNCEPGGPGEPSAPGEPEISYCTSLSFGEDIMAYGEGLEMHPAVREVTRYVSEQVLHECPADPITLTLDPPGCSSATLRWESPATCASEYDLRTSTAPISANNFDQAARLETSSPLPAGATETYEVGLTDCLTRHYFAVRWHDPICGWAVISNIVSARKPCPPGGCDEPEFTAAPVIRTLALSAPAPNPSGGRFSLDFALPADAPGASFDLAVYDLAGRRVRTIDGGPVRAGRHTASLDARESDGRRLDPGVYFVRLTLGDRRVSRVLVIR
jgi:hypothetical protein